MQEDPKEEESSFALSDSEIQSIEENLEEGREEAVETAVASLSAPDCAELLGKVSDENRHILMDQHSSAIPPDAYVELDSELCKDVLEDMEAPQVAEIISSLESDDALGVIENLEADFQKEVIRRLPFKTRISVEEGLSFSENSAGRLLQKKYVSIPQTWTVEETIESLQASSDEDIPEVFSDIFILTADSKLAGKVSLARLIRSKSQTKLESLALEEIHSIPASMDQEEVAQIFRRDYLLSAAVVDLEERMIGVITIDDVLGVIDEEAQEDILRLAGVNEASIFQDVIATTGSRFRWLLVNLLTAILASIIISLFDATIQEIVALAILMPIVASMGGNAGTQALTVAVRGMAMREISNINSFRIIWKETLVGTLNGFLFAVIIGLITTFWFENFELGIIIAVAMLINLVVAGLFGAGIPIFLNRIGSDPAISSTVILTTVTDVIGFLVFLGLAAIFLI
ncbi:MAG: magnesium transporter [Nitrospina sp.]|jgi:magnesium transporter|nr:magnesium transporter [Nitrospina sp.]